MVTAAAVVVSDVVSIAVAVVEEDARVHHPSAPNPIVTQNRWRQNPIGEDWTPIGPCANSTLYFRGLGVSILLLIEMPWSMPV